MLVVSDNKLNVETMTTFIPHTWNRSNPGMWKTRSGNPVKNQRLYRRMWSTVLEHPNIDFQFMHMNSHRNPESYWEDMRDRILEAGHRANRTTALLFMDLNDRADEIATRITLREKFARVEKSELRLRLEPVMG